MMVGEEVRRRSCCFGDVNPWCMCEAIQRHKLSCSNGRGDVVFLGGTPGWRGVVRCGEVG